MKYYMGHLSSGMPAKYKHNKIILFDDINLALSFAEAFKQYATQYFLQLGAIPEIIKLNENIVVYHLEDESVAADPNNYINFTELKK